MYLSEYVTSDLQELFTCDCVSKETHNTAIEILMALPSLSHHYDRPYPGEKREPIETVFRINEGPSPITDVC